MDRADDDVEASTRLTSCTTSGARSACGAWTGSRRSRASSTWISCRRARRRRGSATARYRGWAGSSWSPTIGDKSGRAGGLPGVPVGDGEVSPLGVPIRAPGMVRHRGTVLHPCLQEPRSMGQAPRRARAGLFVVRRHADAGGDVSGATSDRGAGTRERIIEAALETVREDGFADTTARAIAARGGFNQALIFYHFGSVDDLLMQAFGRVSQRQVARYREAAGQVDLAVGSGRRSRAGCTTRTSRPGRSRRSRSSWRPRPTPSAAGR